MGKNLYIKLYMIFNNNNINENIKITKDVIYDGVNSTLFLHNEKYCFANVINPNINPTFLKLELYSKGNLYSNNTGSLSMKIKL